MKDLEITITQIDNGYLVSLYQVPATLGELSNEKTYFETQAEAVKFVIDHLQKISE